MNGYLNLMLGYFQCALAIEPFLDHLQEVINESRGEELIICVDAKAHSPMWYANEEDEKVIAMMDFIQHNDLEIINRQFQPSIHKSIWY